MLISYTRVYRGNVYEPECTRGGGGETGEFLERVADGKWNRLRSVGAAVGYM